MSGFNQKEYINRYETEKYFRILTRMPKDLEDQIRKRAEARGESLGGYVKRLILEDLKSQ